MSSFARQFVLAFLLPLTALIVLLMLMSGAGTVLAGFAGVGLGATVLVGAALVSLPGWTMLRVFGLLTVLIFGLIQYYGRLTVANWLPSLFGLVLFIWALPRRHTGIPMGRMPPHIMLFYATLVVWVGMAIANQVPPLIMLTAGMVYLMLFMSLPAIVQIMARDPDHSLDWFERGLAFLPFLQLPFILHQRLFIGSRGTWDHVVGTFGGYYGGTGANADMMVYMVCAVLMALNLHQAGRISARRWWLTLATVFLIIGMGENKAFFVFLPVALVIQQWPQIKRKPAQALLFAGVLMTLLSSLWLAYSTFNYGVRYANQDLSAMEMADKSISLILDPNQVDYEQGEVGRMATLYIWRQHVTRTPLEAWTGFGIGASRKSNITPGTITLAYAPLKISTTALAQLLWDVGLIGTGLYLLSSLSAILTAFRYARTARDPVRRGRYRSIGAILTVLSFTFVYNPGMIESVTVKFLVVMCFASLWVSRAAERWERTQPLE